MDLFTLVATLSLDADGYERDLRKSKRSFFDTAEAIGAKAVAMGNIISRGLEKAAGFVVDFGKSAIDAAAELEAENALFAATFGDLQGEAKKAFSAIEKDTNIYTGRLKTAGTKAFGQFKGAGLDAVGALEQMDRYTRLAADAAAAYDISLEEADEKLRSFLRGNTEAGDSIRLYTSESQRAAYAMEKYGEKWANLTEAQKQMLMLDVVEDLYEMQGVIGQAEREGMSWTNVLANLEKVWRDLKGTAARPIKAVLTPVLQDFKDWLATPEVQKKVEQFGLGVADLVNAVIHLDFPTWEEVKTWGADKIEAITKGVESVANWTLGQFDLPDVDTVKSSIVEWWTGQGDNAYERIKSVLSWTLGEFIAPETETFAANVSEWWNGDGGGKSAFQSVVDWTLGELYLPAWIDLVTGIMNWWDRDISPMMTKVTTWKLGDVQFPSVEEMQVKATAWWQEVWSTIKGIFKINIEGDYYGPTDPALQQKGIDIMTGATMKAPSTSYEVTSGGYGAKGWATGLDYVPYNDMLARLHEGEAVLTKAEAREWRSGFGYGEEALKALVAEVGALRADILGRRDVFTPDGQRIGDIVTERVSRNIARGAKSGRFSPA